MDDVHLSAGEQPAGGPHLRLHAQEPLPTNFFALRLVLQPGGATIDVNLPDMLVGRHTECNIRLPLPDVSRRHCRLQFVENCWQVIDLNSLNGLQVNGEQVLQAPLEQGDLLKIGGFTFHVELLATSPAPEREGHVESILKTLSGQLPRKAS